MMRELFYVSHGKRFRFKRSPEVQGDYQLDLIDHVVWVNTSVSAGRIWPVMEAAMERLRELSAAGKDPK